METEDRVGTTPAAATGTGGDLRRRVASFEHLGNLRRAKPALIFACFVWPLFGLLDVAHVWLTDIGDLGALLALRAVPMPWFLLAAWRVSRRPPIGERELWVLVYGAIYVLLVVVALEAVVTGGLTSYYAEANLAVLAATTAVPRPARTHAKHVVLAMLVYPVTMVIAGLFHPAMEGQLRDTAALYAFGAHTAMIWTTGAIVLLASHRLWALRREIYETRSIGRYELRRRIGKGGMGEVWAAWHRGLEREVALKILKLGDEGDAVGAARFEREVRLCSGLTHPHTVRVFDYGTTEDGLLYYAMELLSGLTLAQLVRRDGPMRPERAVHLIAQAARALAEAHDRGIVHRDVKPENLFVTAAGGEADFVKVLDFGIARIDEDESHLTRTGAVAGTPSTMSPEVIQGAAATPASDVYGLGAVLYFTLTGQPPFVGEVPAQTLIAHVREPVVPPSVRAPHVVPRDLDALVVRALAKSPEDRFRDGRELALALATSSVAGKHVPPSTELPLPSDDDDETDATPSEADTKVAIRRRG